MALTVQNVVDDVSFETRKQLDGTSGAGDDFALIVRWIDQTHKDLLHTSIYRHALRATTTVTSTSGTLSYALTPTDIRRIEAVFDERSLSMLSPLDLMFTNSSTADPPNLPKAARPPKELSSYKISSPNPSFFWLTTVVTSGTNAHTLHIFPAPQASDHAGTVRIYYIKHVATLSTAAAELQTGEDMRDAIVAGVTMRAFRYLNHPVEADRWTADYARMLLGERVS